MGPRAGLDRCGNSRHPTGIRSPDHRGRSQSLYRLSYRGPHRKINVHRNTLLNVLVRRKGAIVMDSNRSEREPELGTCQPTNKPLRGIIAANFSL